MNCPKCNAEVLEIDVKCGACGAAIGSTGAHRMLGQVMLGQYELVDVLGQGGMSVVFKGRHKMTDQEVALKILPPELAAHSQVKSRFLEEAKALAALDHPNIVHLYNFGQENGFFVLAMQLVQGSTWERLILEATKLDWAQSCRITVDVLRALEYAHGRGIVHRDMKPSNVLVRAHDNAATVMDFGIAKMTTSTRLTATGQTMGTVRYMSPEQVRGQDVDLTTDIYSLGATFYESLVGDTPFDGSTHFEIMTKHLSEVPKRPSSLGIVVPQAVEDALMRSLAKKPEDRWQNARDMRKVLEAALRDADLGFVETQRVSAEIVSAVRAATPGHPRPATSGPTDLSDALEPDDKVTLNQRKPKQKPTTKPTTKPRSMVPVIVIGTLVVAAGTTAAIFVSRSHKKPAGITPTLAIVDVVFTAQQKFGPLTVEATGTLSVDEIERGYRGALVELRAIAKRLDRKGRPPLEFADPTIDAIVSLPRTAMCAPSAYLGESAPPDCDVTLATVGIGLKGTKRMMVVEDRASLQKALLLGAAKALCTFPSEA
ncbi:MAG: serine/threonine-protein kinase, partial [Proteobacteria bacterium]|nr:serine/threonine-protein kinase [Pseudomonadota bacterium]